MQAQDNQPPGNNEATLIAPRAQQGIARLILRRPDGQLQEFGLDKEEFTIGRLSSSDMVLQDDRSVSRRHAVIRRSNAGYVIEDLQSNNGTYVDGERIQYPFVLHNGHSIKVGDNELTFKIISAPLGAVAPSVPADAGATAPSVPEPPQPTFDLPTPGMGQAAPAPPVFAPVPQPPAFDVAPQAAFGGPPQPGFGAPPAPPAPPPAFGAPPPPAFPAPAFGAPPGAAPFPPPAPIPAGPPAASGPAGMVTCQNCGQTTQAGKAFCLNCGSNLAAQQGAPGGPPPFAAPSPGPGGFGAPLPGPGGFGGPPPGPGGFAPIQPNIAPDAPPAWQQPAPGPQFGGPPPGPQFGGPPPAPPAWPPQPQPAAPPAWPPQPGGPPPAPQFGPPPGAPQFGGPPAPQFGGPPPGAPQFGGPPPGPQFGGPPGAPQFGGPPPGPQFGGPPPGPPQFGGPPPQGQFAPPGVAPGGPPAGPVEATVFYTRGLRLLQPSDIVVRLFTQFPGPGPLQPGMQVSVRIWASAPEALFLTGPGVTLRVPNPGQVEEASLRLTPMRETPRGLTDQLFFQVNDANSGQPLQPVPAVAEVVISNQPVPQFDGPGSIRLPI